jgi:hypothetical protein
MRPGARTVAVPQAVPLADAPACCEGPSFSAGARRAGTLLVLALAVLAWRNAGHPVVLVLVSQYTVFVLVAAAIVALGWWNLRFSRTGIDATHLHQGCGPLRRSVALADISQLQLIRVRGLQWLITPRLVVKARGWGKCTFHGADPGVLQAFEALAYGSADKASCRRA